MPAFLEHIERLLSPSQDHTGDRALERWSKYVANVSCNSKPDPVRAITLRHPVSRSQIKVPIMPPHFGVRCREFDALKIA